MITSKQNSLIKLVRSLSDKKFRDKEGKEKLRVWELLAGRLVRTLPPKARDMGLTPG